MPQTLLANNPVTVLQPVGPWSLTQVFTTVDPINGNYFIASGSDLVTFYALPAEDAPLWSAATTYTAGQVVQAYPAYNALTAYPVGAIVSSVGINYYSLQAANTGNTPATSPTFWAVYTGDDGATAYIAIANASPNLNQLPASSPTFWSAYGGSTLNVSSAPDACTQRTANIVNYAIPDGGFVEFRVVPGSVFTQANGQVQFQASSNLVSVLVRSL
jgi:hypothetical protein